MSRGTAKTASAVSALSFVTYHAPGIAQYLRKWLADQMKHFAVHVGAGYFRDSHVDKLKLLCEHACQQVNHCCKIAFIIRLGIASQCYWYVCERFV